MASLVPFYPGKTFKPPLPADHLPRPELIQILHRARDRRLILVCAPAGFGKSTLAMEYSESLGSEWQTLWVALDEYDAQPIQFLRTLIAALRPLYTGLGESVLVRLDQLHNQQPIGIEQFTATLLTELRERHAPAQPVLLVLDDYHLAQNSQCDRLCGLLLDNLPANFQLLLTSRRKPEWHLARLRLTNQLLELTEDQLRLSADASRHFLSAAGITPDPALFRHILERNEGWIAGLRLMAIATEQPGEGLRQRIPDASTPLVGEYLLEEVILGQPASVLSFLQEVAWLDRFNAELCDCVRSADDSGEIIDYLLTHRVFLVPLDGEGRWYRFHHLFSDVLRERAAFSSPQRRLAVHWEASQWFNRHGRLAEAVEHALAAERPEQAAKLVQLLPLERLLAEQPVSTLLRWKSELPRALQGGSVQLVLVHSWALALACQLEDAEAMLERIQFFLPQSDEKRQRRVIGQALSLKGFLARAAGRLDEAATCCQQSLACLAQSETGSRFMAMLTLADCELCHKRIDAARQWARDALELAQRSGNPYFEAQAILLRARLMMMRGQVTRALQLMAAQRRQLDSVSHPEGLPIRARSAIYEGYLLNLLGDRDAALAALEQGKEEALRCRDVHVLMAYCLKAGILARRSESIAMAFETLTEAERLMHLWDIPPVYYLGWVTALKADLWISSDRQELAEHWLPRLRQTYCSGPAAAPPPFFHALPVIIELVYVRLLWVKGDQVAAESCLRELAGRLQRDGERLQQLAVLVHLVRVLYLQHRNEEAEQQLRAALSLAGEDCVTGVFHSLMQQPPGPLFKALERAPSSRLRDELMASLQGTLQAGERSPASGLREPLSSRELDVLKCIAQGYSNQQISEALFISLHTVKSHARRINHKLGVARRTQAVAQAKLMGLLS